MDEASAPTFRPPYMAFQTFWSFIEEVGSRPRPPRIDRSMMGSKSGTDQAGLMAALTGFGLIGPDQKVETALEELAAAPPEQRKAKLAHLIRRYYPEQVRVSEENGTEQQLRESLKTAFNLESADTRRKAMTFFLHAARTAGLPLSPYFPAIRSGSGAPGVPRPKRTTVKKPRAGGTAGANGSSTSTTPQTAAGDTYTVSLQSGGTVSVAVSVNLFSLTTEDRTFVIDLVDKLKGYKHDESAVPEPATV